MHQRASISRKLVGLNVRLVSDTIIPISEMPPGSTALVCDANGDLELQPSSFELAQITIDIERAGSTVALLAADARKISSMRYKSALLQALRTEGVEVVELMERMVECWGKGQGRSYTDRDEDENGHTGTIARTTFDFTASAYYAFMKDPQQFGWNASSNVHAAAVKAMRKPLKKAFETEMPGPWAEPSGEEGFVVDGDDDGGKGMSTKLFNILIKECSAALKIRQQRNQYAAHPLDSSDPEARAQMLNLYRKAVAAPMPIVDSFMHLAKTAIRHVEEKFTQNATTISTSDASLLPIVHLTTHD
eukprot:349731-Chlamydomonas_euryale.AAC.3